MQKKKNIKHGLRSQVPLPPKTTFNTKKPRHQARWESRKATKNYEKEIAHNMKNNPKLFWKYVNSKLKTWQPLLDLTKPDGNLTTWDEEKFLTISFQNVFTKEDTQSIPCPKNKNITSMFNDIHITKADLIKYIQRLKPNKFTWPDGIHPKIPKELTTVIVKPLCMLFQTSLSEGYLPCHWKISNISPIYKNGPKTETGNYRPVCLTSIICKVMKSFLRDKVLRLMRGNDLPSEHQHGFA